MTWKIHIQGETFEVETPFGRASGPVHKARIAEAGRPIPGSAWGRPCLFAILVPYRANVFALKELGATHLLSLSAVGSLARRTSPEVTRGPRSNYRPHGPPRAFIF